MLKMNQIDQFIFIDETSFWLNKCRPYYGWYGDTVEKQCDLKFSQSKLYSTKLHVWGGISSRGTISLEIFTENMTKEIYKEILKKKRKQMEQLYPHGYRIIQDNDPKHRSKIVKQYIDKYIFSNSFLPPYSPDINPIELIWGLLKKQVSKDSPETIDEVKKSIRKYWRQLTPEIIQPYIKETNERYKWIINNQGEFYIK
ncbi:hypothetical protein ABPG72_022855 [Tetrahymena utriculariae]